MELKNLILKTITLCSLTFYSCENSTLGNIEGNQQNNNDVVINISEFNDDEIMNVIEHLEIKYPITVKNNDDNIEEINDNKEFTDYNKRTKRCRFVYPITIIKDNNLIKINSPKELRDYLPKKELDEDNEKEEDVKGQRPPLPHVFPFKVTKDGTEISINNQQEMDTYLNSIGKEKPNFVFPIKLLDKNNNTVEVNSKEEIDNFLKMNM